MLFVELIGGVGGARTAHDLDYDVIQATVLGAAGVPEPHFFVIIFVWSLPPKVIGGQLRVHGLPSITIERYWQAP